ncbi:helix-turn-helix domain-containing protein [Nonlabens xiamenensis]|uniref:helix-turn-helix domain-containing protein n=1 Tax=Nonlabens xiamenensis TaxID=2341043 RepID=UPI001F0CDC3B|nr:helix-turn-helix transcriptional regulator [Nonlabens xiamenensis]
MDHNDLNASSFAEKIDVGRSTISHIISGRNKPSLDFVMGIVKEFPEVDWYWLLHGTGDYPKNTSAPPQQETMNTTPSELPKPIKNKEVPHQQPAELTDLFTGIPPADSTNTSKVSSNKTRKNLQKVILLYDDGSFEYFIN